MRILYHVVYCLLFRMIAMYRKIFHVNHALAYFMLNEFPIETKKCLSLDAALSPEEQVMFGLNLKGGSGLHYVSFYKTIMITPNIYIANIKHKFISRICKRIWSLL